MFFHHKRKILTIVFLTLALSLSAQQQYSIDKEKLGKSRRLTIKEFFQKQKFKRKARQDQSAAALQEKKTDEFAKRYEKNKQRDYVRKRMKESRNMARKFNKGKPQVDLITYLEYKINKYYGRFF